MLSAMEKARNKALSFASGARGRRLNPRSDEITMYDTPTAPLTSTKRLQNYQKQNLITCGSERLTVRQQRSIRRGERRDV